MEVGLDIFEGKEGKRSEERRISAKQLTNRRFDEMFGEIEREMAELKGRMSELKGKMRHLIRTSGSAVEAQRTGVRWNDHEAHRASSSDREDRGADQDETRTGSKVRR